MQTNYCWLNTLIPAQIVMSEVWFLRRVPVLLRNTLNFKKILI